MLQSGVIKDSLWAVSVVLVCKKDGSLRFCVDYHKLNACTHQSAYLLPRVEESLMVIGQAHYFITLDLASGHWQVPAREQDRGQTAFITLLEIYELSHMPFGLSNSLSTFQRLVECCIGDYTIETVPAYLDYCISLFKKKFWLQIPF